MKDEILKVTFKLFGEYGYSLSLSEIADQVNLKKASLYNHFKSKEVLLKIVIENEIDRYIARNTLVFERITGKNCEEQLKALYFSAADYYKEPDNVRFWRQLMNLKHERLRAFSGQKLREEMVRFQTQVGKIFEEGYKNAELDYPDRTGLINLYYTIFSGALYKVRSSENEMEVDLFTRNIWETYWNLIKAKRQPAK